MIAKISSTANLGGALGYNFRKLVAGEASVLLAEGLYADLEGGYTMDEMLADMQVAIPKKCRTKNVVFHCSLNPHPDERLSDETLSQIAREYMEALGYGGQPYIVFKHNDIAREHIHIVSLRVDSEGRKISDKFEGRRSKVITDALERKYGLIPSTGSKQTQATALPANLDGSASGNIRSEVALVLREVLAHYRFCSLGEFNAILKKYKLVVEEVKTTYRGKQYDGLVYVPTDDKGSKIGNPIHASKIGRGVGYSAIQRKIQQSKQSIKSFIAGMRQRVLAVMRTSPRNEEELLTRLEEQGLRCLIRKNESGRIYGITFIDDTQGIALNGSRLGKGYSANGFEAYFTDTTQNPFLDESLYGKLPNMKQDDTALAPSMPTKEEEGDNLIDEVLEDLIGDAPLSTGNDDWKEAAWQRKLRRQSKLRLRRKR
ncbi:MAG: relaxase/mobilization nuclease domain-containing protein [Bacteroides pyogenes]|uniref:conjugal transfer protein MobB n=1 Tax=Bacteroides pyogenes TaxID=310300 RepID=UPI00242F7F79|nr:conjugal transfer protein MobB [Bacteroides pyogenes]MCI7069841.1 relaxase/mobilization nuclease domain-containing protein [Bacteroides pyogenes]